MLTPGFGTKLCLLTCSLIFVCYKFSLLSDSLPISSFILCPLAPTILSSILSTLNHGNTIHFAMNMVATWHLGSSLEPRFGTLPFLTVIALMMTLCALLYIGAAQLLIQTIGYQVPCVVGFSAVLFALTVIDSHLHPRTAMLMGIAIPNKYYPFALLIFVAATIPYSSFIGHLLGILVGYGFVNRVLWIHTPYLRRIEGTRVFTTCVIRSTRGLGYVPCPPEIPFSTPPSFVNKLVWRWKKSRVDPPPLTPKPSARVHNLRMGDVQYTTTSSALPSPFPFQQLPVGYFRNREILHVHKTEDMYKGVAAKETGEFQSEEVRLTVDESGVNNHDDRSSCERGSEHNSEHNSMIIGEQATEQQQPQQQQQSNDVVLDMSKLSPSSPSKPTTNSDLTTSSAILGGSSSSSSSGSGSSSGGSAEDVDYFALSGPVGVQPCPWGGWMDVDATSYQVRGASYLSNKGKEMSAPSLCRLMEVEIWRCGGSGSGGGNGSGGGQLIPHIATQPWSFLQKVRQSSSSSSNTITDQKQFYIVMNFLLPGPPEYNVALYFREENANNSSAASQLLQRFKTNNNNNNNNNNTSISSPAAANFRDQRLKLIPRVEEGNFLVKRGVGATPTVLGKILTQTFYSDVDHPKVGYVEVDVDVGSSTVATTLVRLVRGYATSVVIDLVFLLEGSTPQELPECCLGGVRLCKVDLTKALSCPS